MTHLPFWPVLSCFNQFCISNCFCCFFKWCQGHRLFSTPHTLLAQMNAALWLLPQSPELLRSWIFCRPHGPSTSWTLATLTKQTGHELSQVPPGLGLESNSLPWQGPVSVGRSLGVHEPHAGVFINAPSLATSFFHHNLPCFPGLPGQESWLLPKHLPTLSLLSSGTRSFSYDWTATMDLIRFYYQLKPRPSISCNFEFYILGASPSVKPALPSWLPITPYSFPSPAHGQDASTPDGWTCPHRPTNLLGAICPILTFHQPLVMSTFPNCFCFPKGRQILTG